MSIYMPSAKSHSVYIASMTDILPGIWQDNNQLTYLIDTWYNSISRPLYVWDLYALSDSLNGDIVDGYVIADINLPWYKIWLTNINASGSEGDVNRNLPTVFSVSPYNQEVASAHVTSMSLATHPLIIEDALSVNGFLPEIHGALKILYYATVYPAYPLLITTSLPNNQTYGPTFLSEITFRVDGTESPSKVSINASFTGGKSIYCARLPITPPNIYEKSILRGYDGIIPVYITGSDYASYRTVSLYDCVADINTDLNSYDNITDLRDAVFYNTEIESISPDRRLITVRLSVSQNFDFKFVSASNTIPRTDKNGPRYIALRNRTVKGTLTFSSPERDFPELSLATLNLFFGGPFLFPLSNVRWQPPRLVAESDGTYFYEYDFIAHSAIINGDDGVVTAPLVANPTVDTGVISEFILNSTPDIY